MIYKLKEALICAAQPVRASLNYKNMRSIEARFKNLQLKKPNLSSYMSFAGAIKYQEFSKDPISRKFNQLVEKTDYDKKDKKRLIVHLVELSNLAEEHQKGGNFASLLKEKVPTNT